MNVLLIGSGGREHALASKLIESPKVSKLYCANGNGGTSLIAENVNISPTNIDGIRTFVMDNDIDYVVVAPDDPLAMGLVDILEVMGVPCFGPTASAARLESSKAFSKDLMKKYHIPTAEYEVFDKYESAMTYIESAQHPLVIKADGLALGKGVLICENVSDSKEALKQIMLDGAFGKAGNKVVIEEFLVGKEVSVLSFTDSKTIVAMPPVCDHKRVFDNDEGLNTGGMGTFTPAPFYTPEMEKEVHKNIILPTLNALNSEGIKFKGVIYFGLISTANGVKVIEYNARFGDPETQVVMPLLETDLMEIFEAVTDEKLDTINIKWKAEACVCVVLASGGYPSDYPKGLPITIGDIHNVQIFHAGTTHKNGVLVTNGGRVMGVVAKGETVEEARATVYHEIPKIHFDKMHYRKDIGLRK